MGRLTKIMEETDKQYFVGKSEIQEIPAGYTGKAIMRLSAFETLQESLFLAQREISAEMELLRTKDKTKSARFRELMGQKLMNVQIIGLFTRFGLDGQYDG